MIGSNWNKVERAVDLEQQAPPRLKAVHDEAQAFLGVI